MAIQGMLWTFAVVALLHSARGQQLTFGFGELDFSNPESKNITVSVVKTGSNVGDLIINITPRTYAQLESVGIDIPAGIGADNRPDPAEFETNGKQDFDNEVIQVTFPATEFLSQVEESVDIYFKNDEINEQLEGFYLHATLDTAASNAMDVQQASPVRNGVALININDDDIIALTFEMANYTVGEDAGVVDDLIYVAKEDGRASEQTLRVFVEVAPNQGRCIRGPLSSDPFDFTIPTLGDPEQSSVPIELVFEVTDSRLNISFEIIEDAILELSGEAPNLEHFVLVLSVPENPAVNQESGSIFNADVFIIDNEPAGRIGWEEPLYSVVEGDVLPYQTVSACARVFEPAIEQISSDVLAAIFADDVDTGSATKTDDYLDLEPGRFNGDSVFIQAPEFRGCAQLTVAGDVIPEGNETLQLQFVTIAFTSINAKFVIDPNVTEVIIIDDDEEIATPMPTPSPTDPPTDPPPTGVVVTPSPSSTPTSTPVGMGGDPHYSILLPTGQLLCYSVQGEHDFAFNLISNKLLQMNALFIADSKRDEITWIGELGVVVRNGTKKQNGNSTSLRFCAKEQVVCIGDKVKLNANGVDRLTFSNGKLSISERLEEGDLERPEVLMEFPDFGISFTVVFVRGKHLDMIWNKVEPNMGKSHGMIGQFFRKGVKIDESRRLLLLPKLEPVAVMRKPVWHFMERDSPDESLCWVAMNSGYQGKGLLQGHYLDYLVNDVLATDFKFKKSEKKRSKKKRSA